MKRTILIPVILLGLGHLPEAVGQNTDTVIPGVSVENSNMNREGKYLAVEINLDINKLDVDANRAVLLTPRLVNGTDSLDLPSVGIYGRRRYYYYVRNGIGSISGENETVYRASGYNQCIMSRIIYPEMRFRSGKTLSVIFQAAYKRIIHSNRFWFFAKHSDFIFCFR